MKCETVMQKKEHIIRIQGVFFTDKKKKKRKRSMLNRLTTNDGSDHHHQIIIGDVLLHSETKITAIPVVIQSISLISSVIPNKPIIHRLSPNSSGTNGSQTIIPCDLKNNIPVKVSHARTKTSPSSKKLLRMHKAGLAFVKEFKSKVITPNDTEPKALTTTTIDDNERTHL